MTPSLPAPLGLLPDGDYDDLGGILAAGLTVYAKKFPTPNIEGLTAEEAEIVLANWRATFRTYYDELHARQREQALRK